MRLTVDANVLFSAFLRKGVTRKLMLDRRLDLYAPDFLLQEFKKYAVELIKRSGLRKNEAFRLSALLLARIKFLKVEELLPYKEAAKHLTSDEKDEPYVACALAVGTDLWSKDRHLKQSRIKCWTTEELVDKLLL